MIGWGTATLGNPSMKKCAFCKYWYDPTNSAIEPATPQAGYWKYERNIKCKCTKTGLTKPAFATCNRYECKL